MLAAIVIGGSAGSLEPLFEVLAHLPDAVTAPIAIVMHLHPTHPSLLPQLLQRACPRRHVHEGEDKEPLRPSGIYVAPPNYHMLVERDGTLSLSVDDPVNFSRPSIDVLFESAADAFTSGVAAVLLSGSNADGAAGLLRVARAGGDVLVQSDATYPTMPDAGAELVPTAQALPAAELARSLTAIAERKGTS